MLPVKLELLWLWMELIFYRYLHRDIRVHRIAMLKPNLCSAWKRPAVGRFMIQPHSFYTHTLRPGIFSQHKNCFSSGTQLRQKNRDKDSSSSEEWDESQTQRKKGGRNPAAPTSLRRVAVEAQRSRDKFFSKAQLREQGLYQTKVLIIQILSLKYFTDHLLFE